MHHTQQGDKIGNGHSLEAMDEFGGIAMKTGQPVKFPPNIPIFFIISSPPLVLQFHQAVVFLGGFIFIFAMN
jgi:hypothetical protein